MKKDLEPNNNNEVEAVAFDLQQLVSSMGLGEKVSVELRVGRKQNQQLCISGPNGEFLVGNGNGIEKLAGDKFSFAIDLIARCIGRTGNTVTSTQLLKDNAFSSSCLTELSLPTATAGNKFLKRFTNSAQSVIPIFYGSTSGLNAAELLETEICAESFDKKGIETEVIFDVSGADSPKAVEIKNESTESLSPQLRGQLSSFILRLGNTSIAQITEAAALITKEKPKIKVVPASEIFLTLGKKLTVGKLMVLARLAGQDPRLFEGLKLSDALKIADRKDKGREFVTRAVTDIILPPAGFSFYARDAIIGAEFDGVVGLPFKLTTHANIYKPLGGFGGLLSQREGQNGAILLPIQRHRIQTRSQSETGSDPVDIRVLAFLGLKFPNEMQRLISDFRLSCKVLSPTEAISQGLGDKKFIIENYFPI